MGGRTLQLTEHSRLTIRTDADKIASFLPLAGKGLRILDRTLRIGGRRHMGCGLFAPFKGEGSNP
jgi:hypothetical protein